MAWYRCGGGGVPASLKHDMNVVLNKKFNSLDDYDPKEWPELTNLLGKLPEATVSGSNVTFSDGADDVPLKACEVALPASLDGYSSVTVHHTDGQTPPVFSEDYTVSLGRTIYGGEADIVNGTGKVTWKKIVADGVNVKVTGGYASGANRLPTIQVSDAVKTPTDIKSDYLTTTYSVIDTEDSILLGNRGTSIVLHIGTIQGNDGTHGYSSDAELLLACNSYLADHNLTIVYKLSDANATDFTFDGQEIPTRLGNNTMWSDGDMSVTYRRDIDLALGGQ